VLSVSLTASAAQKTTVYDFTFTGYCDGIELVVTNNFDLFGPGFPQVFIGGFHELINQCGFRYNGTDVGFVHFLSAKVPPHAGVGGPVLDASDNIFDATTNFPFGGFTGAQAEYVLDTVGGTWALYGAFFGDETDFLLNAGTLTPGLPAKVNGGGPNLAKTTIGSVKLK